MRSNAWIVSVLMIVVGALVACVDDPVEAESDPDPTVTGSWLATSQGITVFLALTEAEGGLVTGTGIVEETFVSVSAGTHAFPALSLTLSASGLTDLDVTGQVRVTDITATLNGFGFNGFVIILDRQTAVSP